MPHAVFLYFHCVAMHRFWAGTLQEYYMLYNYTANAVKAVDNELTVGGPATCGLQYLPDFVAAAAKVVDIPFPVLYM